MFALGLAIGVVLAVGALLYFQVSYEISKSRYYYYWVDSSDLNRSTYLVILKELFYISSLDQYGGIRQGLKIGS